MLFTGVFLVPAEGEKQAARKSYSFAEQSCPRAAAPLCHEGLAEGLSCFVHVLGNPGGVASFQCPVVTGGERRVRPASRAHLQSRGSQCSGVRVHVPL